MGTEALAPGSCRRYVTDRQLAQSAGSHAKAVATPGWLFRDRPERLQYPVRVIVDLFFKGAVPQKVVDVPDPPQPRVFREHPQEAVSKGAQHRGVRTSGPLARGWCVSITIARQRMQAAVNSAGVEVEKGLPELLVI